MSDFLTFKLEENFIDKYKQSPVPWGFGVLSELVFIRTYSRVKEDGGKERWYEVCRRVVEGMMDIQKKHSVMYNLKWDEMKAQLTARAAYDGLFNLKWSPAGRGLWAMGTELVNKHWDSSSLYNCFFVSTKDLHKDFAEPFTFLMSASMHGGGVGFDTLGKGAHVYKGKGTIPYSVPDSREGWVKSVELLLRHYVGGPKPVFDYSRIRAKGAPIKRFGGIAPGYEPLALLHARISDILEPIVQRRVYNHVTSREIVDLMNVIGVAVVSGNVRRSAEIGLGTYDDKTFWNLKDYSNPENEYRKEFGWMSNNTLQVFNDTDVDYDEIAERMATEGEPGLMFMDNARNYGRMNNGPDYRDTGIMGCNPCGEIGLFNHESCNLFEQYISRMRTKREFVNMLKFGYMYSKTVTLLPTVWPETNGVQFVNRRIGGSVTGTAQFVDSRGYKELQRWLDDGYKAIRGWDDTYSRWLGIRESIKVTTSKPSGTVSLLAGVSPGVHWPTSTHYIRRVTLSSDSPLAAVLTDAGYSVPESVYSPGTSVVAEIPTHVTGVRSEDNVSVFEKVGLVAHVQKYWADNMVSNTTTFSAEEEIDDLANALKLNERSLKSVSALPRNNTAYEQMPEERVEPDTYTSMLSGVKEVDFSVIYDGIEAAEDAQRQLGCDSDSCDIPIRK